VSVHHWVRLGGFLQLLSHLPLVPHFPRHFRVLAAAVEHQVGAVVLVEAEAVEAEEQAKKGSFSVQKCVKSVKWYPQMEQ
jgi:hypothetical protein